jgi:hypothetical protein
MAGFANDHRTTCILKEMRTIRVNRKDQECFVFAENGADYYAVKRYFKVIEEGDASGFFPPGGSPCRSRMKSRGGSECISGAESEVEEEQSKAHLELSIEGWNSTIGRHNAHQ